MNNLVQPSNRILRMAAVCVALGIVAGPLQAEGTRVVSIEEHWELQVGQPDVERSAPQTTMVMSPTGDLEGFHFLFMLNHSNAGSYEPGGMQVQLWDEEGLIADNIGAAAGVLSHHEETVTWVQRFDLADGELTFRITQGSSETWGEFGGGDDLALSLSTSLTSLNGYRPAVSLTESQVGFAENRVVSLVLKRLVWRTEDGQVFQHDAPIPIDTSLDP